MSPYTYEDRTSQDLDAHPTPEEAAHLDTLPPVDWRKECHDPTLCPQCGAAAQWRGSLCAECDGRDALESARATAYWEARSS